MNKERRKALSEAMELLEQAKDIVETCCSEEEEYRDNMPDNLVGSDRYETAEAAIDCMNEALEQLEDVVWKIEEAQA